MPHAGQNAYLESRFTTAQPAKLVRILYHAAMDAVREARRHLGAGDIARRSREISKAFAILTELAGALDGARGGDIAARLAQLYDYLQRRLLEANARQTEAPLAEVWGLLATLAEAWDGVAAQARPPAPVPSQPWAQAEPDSAAGHAWSL